MCSLPLQWLKMSAFAVCVVLMVDRGASGAEETPAPWLQLDNADKYVFVGKTVWDIEAGKIASPTDAPGYMDRPRAIVGVKDRIFEPGLNKGAPSMPGIGHIMFLGAEDRKRPTLDDKPPQSLSESDYWAAPDHRRVVWIEKGDYWRGEVDWDKIKIVNRKQVTSLGVFSATNSPMLWWGNLLFVNGNFDKAKPIVRIDLVSGATEEMETHRAFMGFSNHPGPGPINCLVSPNGCRIIGVTNSVIYCYDARTGKPSMLRNKFEDIPSTRGRQLFVGEPGPVWTDDDTVYSLDGQGYLARIDLHNSRMDVLQEKEVNVPGTGSKSTRYSGLLPAGRYLDMAILTSADKGGPMSGKRFLYDMTTGERTPLPFDDKAYGKWLDDNTYLHVISTGGLSSVGTWVYDRKANASKRLTGITIDTERMVHLKKQNQVWTVSQKTGNNLIRMKLDGSGSDNLGDCELMIPCKLPSADDNPIDLGFTDTTVDLWKAPVVDEATLAATQPPEEPAGKIKLFQDTKDLSAEDKEFAEQAYDFSETNGMLSNYCDPCKIALKALEAHKADPQAPVQNLWSLNKIDFAACADRDRISRWGHDHTFEMIWSDQKLTTDQKKAIADKTGPALAEAFFKESKPDLKNMQMLFQKCLDESRASVTGQPVTATNTPAQQPKQAQAPQQQQQQQQNPQDDVDKTADTVKKGKNTADKIKGIFKK